MIEGTNITVCYERGADALRGVSLSLRRGEMVAVLGGNGAGKSTLLRALSGLIPLREGQIRLDDEDVTDRDRADFALAELKEYVRVSVQIVFEQLADRREAAARDAH